MIPRGRRQKCSDSWLNPGSDTPSFLQYPVSYIDHSYLIIQDANNGSQKSLGTIVEVPHLQNWFASSDLSPKPQTRTTGCLKKCQSLRSDSLRPHGLYPIRPLCPWNSPGKKTVVGSHSLLQGIFPTQGSNPGLPNSRQILYHLLNSYYLLMIMGTIWPLFHKLFLVKTWNQVWWHVHQNVLFGSYVMEVEVDGSHLVLALSVLWSKLKDAVMSIYWVPSLCWARCLALYNHYLCNNSMNRSYSSHFTEERKVWRITSLSLPITQSAWQSRGQILACFQVMLFGFVFWNSTPWLL